MAGSEFRVVPEPIQLTNKSPSAMDAGTYLRIQGQPWVHSFASVKCPDKAQVLTTTSQGKQLIVFSSASSLVAPACESLPSKWKDKPSSNCHFCE